MDFVLTAVVVGCIGLVAWKMWLDSRNGTLQPARESTSEQVVAIIEAIRPILAPEPVVLPDTSSSTPEIPDSGEPPDDFEWADVNFPLAERPDVLGFSGSQNPLLPNMSGEDFDVGQCRFE